MLSYAHKNRRKIEMFPPPPLAILWNYNDRSCCLESLTSLGVHGSRCHAVPCDSEWDNTGTEAATFHSEQGWDFDVSALIPVRQSPHSTVPLQLQRCSPHHQWPCLPLKFTDTRTGTPAATPIVGTQKRPFISVIFTSIQGQIT